jgi:hypothetical protein
MYQASYNKLLQTFSRNQHGLYIMIRKFQTKWGKGKELDEPQENRDCNSTSFLSNIKLKYID